jgi:hypothetical protein
LFQSFDEELLENNKEHNEKEVPVQKQAKLEGSREKLQCPEGSQPPPKLQKMSSI